MPAFKLAAPIQEEFTLEKTDALFGCSGTRVTIRQATQEQHERRSTLFENLVREYDSKNSGERLRTIQKYNEPELRRMEAFLTVVSSNIEAEDGAQLFRAGMTEVEFQKAWGLLPPSVAAEIHSKVLLVNKLWAGPEGE